MATGTITGAGTTGTIPKFTGTNAIGNSRLIEKDGKIGLGTTSPVGVLSVVGASNNAYAIYGSIPNQAGAGVYGLHTSKSGDTAGVIGETNSTSMSAMGVRGIVNSTSPGTLSAGVRGVNFGTNTNGFGVYGSHLGAGLGVNGTSVKGTGVRGIHSDATGAVPGVLGETNSTESYAVGVQGVVTSTSPGGYSAGVRGINNGTSGSGIGVYGSHAGSGYGVYGQAPSGYAVIGATTSGTGVYGQTSTGTGVYGISSSGKGVYGYSSSNYGVHGYAPSGTGVYGQASTGNGVSGSSSSGTGVVGSANTGKGVVGSSSGSFGVQGSSTSSVGVAGYSTNGYGLQGISDSTAIAGFSTNGYALQGVSDNNYALYAETKKAGSYAGIFKGNVYIYGTLGKSAGSFKIDHPLHPDTEYLSHSFVESPDMMNVYNGNTSLDKKGEATITLPAYFQSLNRDFRYQLTPIGAPAMLYVAKEISGNQFKIAGGKVGMKVSWQVTGIRNDAYAREHRIQVEENKTGDDRGKYLYPAGFGAGNDKSITFGAPRLASR